MANYWDADYWDTVGVTGYNQFAVPEQQGEVNNLPDMAIPDHNFTLRELVERFSRGLPIGAIKDQLPGLQEGDSEDYLPDPRTLDLAEREQYAEYARYEIQRIRSQKANEQVTEGNAAEN